MEPPWFEETACEYLPLSAVYIYSFTVTCWADEIMVGHGLTCTP